MMNSDAVVEALDCLENAGVSAWVDGGWGIDALVGEQTRDHADLDLVIARDALDATWSALSTLGFEHDARIRPGLPARAVLLDSDRRQIDLHPVVVDACGNGWQPLGDGAWGAYPADGLTGTGLIAGRRVRCSTPQLQLRHHLGYPPKSSDHHDLRLLAQHFKLALPPED